MQQILSCFACVGNRKRRSCIMPALIPKGTRIVLLLSGLGLLSVGCEHSGLARGCRFFQRHDYPRAISSLTSYLESTRLDEDNKNRVATAYFYRGFSKSLMFDFSAALNDYEAAFSIVPNYYPALFNHAKIRILQGDFAEAYRDVLKTWEILKLIESGNRQNLEWFDKTILEKEMCRCFQFCCLLSLKNGQYAELRDLLDNVPEWMLKQSDVARLCMEVYQLGCPLRNLQKAQSIARNYVGTELTPNLGNEDISDFFCRWIRYIDAAETGN